MSEDARAENVERTRRRIIEVLRTHEIVWVDVGCRYACGCDERGILRLPELDHALAHVASYVLPIVEDHAKAERKAGAVDALREVQRALQRQAHLFGTTSEVAAYSYARGVVSDHIAQIEAS